jgi:phytanoyl-CoA hydroxylase
MSDHAIADDPITHAGETAGEVRSPSDADLAAYARDGYLAWGRILRDDEIAELRREYDRVLAGGDGCLDLSAPAGGGAGPGRAGPMLQVMQMCERSLAFRRLLHDPRILAVPRAVLGPNLMLFHDQGLYKPARHGGPVPWHQDNGYWRCRPATLVSCWLTLDDVDAANGAMQVSVGSHLAPAAHDGLAQSRVLIAAPTPDPATVRVVALPAGGCMFHHCQTLHYTAPNTTDRQRRAFVIHFMAPGTRNRDGAVMRVDWAHPMLAMEL